jgi:hypothetical protein
MRLPLKCPMRSPQTEPMRSLEMDPMQSPETDPIWSPQTGASARALQPPPVELDAEGQALREQLRAFHTKAVRKNYKVSTRPPVTLPLSPRVFKCDISLPPLNAQLTWSDVLKTIFRVCSNGDLVVVSQSENISTRAPTYRPRFPVKYQGFSAPTTP